MAKCTVCGKKIKPYFGVCFDCCQASIGWFNLPRRVIISEFMQNFGAV